MLPGDWPASPRRDQLKELAEIIRGEKPNPQWLYDHDLLVHDVSLRACNL